MKQFGIIRRIDELGRVVIPKEMRKALRIKNGDSLDIFIDRENIVLKKYSEINEFSDLSGIIVNLIGNYLKCDVLLCDTNCYLCGYGDGGKSYIKKNVSNDIINILGKRKLVSRNNVCLIEGESREGEFIINPIVSGGDVLGGIIVFCPDEFTSDNINMLNFASKILEKHIEN